MEKKEYRVRKVTRYIVTEFAPVSGGPNGICSEIGEYQNIEQADIVGKALQVASPGATFTTIEDRREPSGTFHSYTPEQSSALLKFMASEFYPKEDAVNTKPKGFYHANSFQKADPAVLS